VPTIPDDGHYTIAGNTYRIPSSSTMGITRYKSLYTDQSCHLHVIKLFTSVLHLIRGMSIELATQLTPPPLSLDHSDVIFNTNITKTLSSSVGRR